MTTRRRFLFTLSAAGLAAATSGWLTSRLFVMIEDGSLPSPRGLGVERWVKTACGFCPAGCGLGVRLVDDLPVGIGGNRASASSFGGLCPAGHAGLWELLSADRVRLPMKRGGKRGSGSWESVSWEEALETIASRLNRLRAKGTPERLVVFEDGSDPLRSFWIDRVLYSYGSPNRVVPEDPESVWNAALTELAGPEAGTLVPDFTATDAIVSFGHELFETDGHPVWQSKMWGRMRAPDRSQLAPLVYVGPRQSPSAFKADLWVPCRPGTEGTVAFGLCYVLFQERLVEKDKIPGPTREEWQDLELWLRGSFHPEVVEAVSGVSPSSLFHAARAVRPSQGQGLALVGSAPLLGSAGLATARGVALLNLLLGALGRRGGWVASPEIPLRLPDAVSPAAGLPPATVKPRIDAGEDANDDRFTQAPGRFWLAMSEGRPYPVDTLIVNGSNPLRELPDPGLIRRAIDRADFVAVMASQMNETAAMADLVLPQATPLESWGLKTTERLLPYSVVTLQQPAISPRYESKQFEDFWFSLAQRLESFRPGTVPGSQEAAVEEMVRGLHESGLGAVPDEPEDLLVIEFLESRGWGAGNRSESFTEFWARFRASGTWYRFAQHTGPDGAVANMEFHIPSESVRRDVEWLSTEDLSGRSSRAFLGTSPEDVCLLVSDSNTLWKGRTAGTPLMMEMASFRSGRGWETICEVNPVTAEGVRLHHGDPAILETAGGSVRVRIQIVPTVPPRAVVVTRGLSESWPADQSAGRRGNPMKLVPFAVDDITGGWLLAADVRLKPDA